MHEALLTSAVDHQGRPAMKSQSVRGPTGCVVNDTLRVPEPRDATSIQANAVKRIAGVSRNDPFCDQQTRSVQHRDPAASKTWEVTPCANPGLQQNESNRQPRKDREHRLDVLVRNLPYRIYSKVCMQLDVKRDFFDDFRMLAERLGMDRDYIRLLEQSKNPTHSVFSSGTVTLTTDSLIKALHRIERFDVAKLLEDWVQEQDMK